MNEKIEGKADDAEFEFNEEPYVPIRVVKTQIEKVSGISFHTGIDETRHE